MYRITRKDLDGQFERLTAAANRVGIDTTGWTYSIGSKTYGNAYGLFRVGEHGAHFDVGMSDYLGMTGPEAHATLHAYAVGLEAAFRAAVPHPSGSYAFRSI